MRFICSCCFWSLSSFCCSSPALARLPWRLLLLDLLLEIGHRLLACLGCFLDLLLHLLELLGKLLLTRLVELAFAELLLELLDLLQRFLQIALLERLGGPVGRTLAEILHALKLLLERLLAAELLATLF